MDAICSQLLYSVSFLLLVYRSESISSNCYGTHYKIINDLRRSTGYVSNNSKAYLCDRQLLENNAWYRFSMDSEGKMPTTKPKVGSCGTYIPMWMNGIHPTIHDGIVLRKVCANLPHVYPFGCGYSLRIRVRNCSGYYIYQLKDPKKCFLAYCAGSKVPNCTNTDPHGSCIANRAPYITMPGRFYAFEKSEFQLSINATDPEGYKWKYEYLPNATVDISKDMEKKIVRIFVNRTGGFSLRVTDGEGLASSVHTIEIVALPCLCQNGGKCQGKKNVSTVRVDFASFKCGCVKPYTGVLCEISPCDNLPCFRGVNCSVTGDRYKCGKCPSKFEGDGEDCQLILPDGITLVEAELVIVSGLKWNAVLSNKTTQFYKRIAEEIETQIKKAYRDAEDFWSVIVVCFRKGSVVVEFQLHFKKEKDDPLKPLRSFVQNDFGSFKVAPNSIKEKYSFEVDGKFHVKSGLEWKDDLLHKNSSYFKTMAFKIAHEIDKIYADEKYFVYIFVIGFRKENAAVKFRLVWRKKVKNPLERLQNEIKDGKLGPFEIDVHSVKEKTTSKPSYERSPFGMPKAWFIVIMCLLSVLVIASIAACVLCIKRKTFNIFVVTQQDDHREICPNNSNDGSSIQLKTRPSRNQVVDLGIDGKNAW
ncbi:uncharacterized protein LOC114535203 isoform X1 [Dendronephthya gigantea]|uniref:uncharacterized protein LOC114535203 isoform X1 n=1 Tax=Dendronephthya gigantea TaxID=151771 RepID=UPI001069ABCD|nr:uncharacterized protein LOC114535203 isoform X1 [Dendronephthya gigantea]